MSLPYVGMPDPSQMPQQVMLTPKEMRPQPEMVVDVLGVRVPAAMLESGYFWAFLIVAAVTVLGVAYFKYGKKSG
jgi:hypothetical protein